MKRLLLATLFILMMVIGAESAVIFTEDFDHYSSDITENRSSGSGGCCPTFYDSTGAAWNAVWSCCYVCSAYCPQDWPITITTAAARVAGTNKRGFRKPMASCDLYQGACQNCHGGGTEQTLFKNLGSNYTELYIRWYEYNNYSNITDQYIKSWRIQNSSGAQCAVPEWLATSGTVVMSFWMTGMSEGIRFTGFNYKTWKAAHPGEWGYFELYINTSTQTVRFWANGTEITQKTGSGWYSSFTNIRYIGIGGNSTCVTGSDNTRYVDYDDVKFSTTYIGAEGTSVYTVGGSVSGYPGGTLTLRNMINGSTPDDKTITANGAYTFPTSLSSGSTYLVSVTAQPSGYTCDVANASGTIDASNISNIYVTCNPTPTRRLGGRMGGGRIR
jgi:hypothetical protein